MKIDDLLYQKQHLCAAQTSNGFRRFLKPGDVEKILIVTVTGWISAAITLAYTSKLNPISILVSGGVITSVIMLSSILAILTASIVDRR